MSALCIAFLSEIFTDVLAHWVVTTTETHILRQTEDKVDRQHVVHAFLFTCVYADSLSDQGYGSVQAEFPNVVSERVYMCVSIHPLFFLTGPGVSTEAESWRYRCCVWSPSQLFFLTGPGRFLLRLSPGLPLTPDPWLTPGCCRTLSRVVFLMAAGEMRSWSARNCSSLRRRGGGKSACLCVSGFRCVSQPHPHRVLIQEASTALMSRLRKPPLSITCRAWMVAPPGEHTLSFSWPGCSSESNNILAAPWG